VLFCCIVVVWYFAREYFRCGARNSASGVLVGSSNITPNTNANRSTTHQREKHGHIAVLVCQTFRWQLPVSVRRVLIVCAPHRTAPHLQPATPTPTKRQG